MSSNRAALEIIDGPYQGKIKISLEESRSGPSALQVNCSHEPNGLCLNCAAYVLRKLNLR